MNGLQFTLDRLRRLIPPAPPTSGLPLARLVAYACFLGGQTPINGFTPQDAQAQNFESALALGATILTPGTTGQTPTSATPGAAGYDLDRWGQVYGVPRLTGEADGAYAVRIVKALIRPTTSQDGLAAVIDEVFGIVGTQVSDVQQTDLPRFNTSITSNSGTACPGWDAPFISTAGAIRVTLPYGSTGQGSLPSLSPGVIQTGGGPVVRAIEAAIATKKAAGVRVAMAMQAASPSGSTYWPSDYSVSGYTV